MAMSIKTKMKIQSTTNPKKNLIQSYIKQPQYKSASYIEIDSLKDLVKIPNEISKFVNQDLSKISIILLKE